MKNLKIIIGMFALLCVHTSFAIKLRNGKCVGVDKKSRVVTEAAEIKVEKVLTAARDESNIESILHCLSQGFDFSVKDAESQMTFLHLVAAWQDYGHIYTVIDALKKYYSADDLEKLMQLTNKQGEYPLETAAKNRKAPAIKALLSLVESPSTMRVLLENDNMWVLAVTNGHAASMVALLNALKSLDLLKHFLFNRYFYEVRLLEYVVLNDRVDLAYEILTMVDSSVKKALLQQRNEDGKFLCECTQSKKMFELLKP